VLCLNDGCIVRLCWVVVGSWVVEGWVGAERMLFALLGPGSEVVPVGCILA
jgi:hypothetical protein